MFIKNLQKIYSIVYVLLVLSFTQAGTTGKLAGKATIKDSGEPMIGANVIINDTNLGAATDADGNDLLGRRVKTLIKDNLDIGTYNIKWNGTSDSGEILPSGMYFYELQSSEFHSVKKLILVK